ncbi:MAG: ribbon-helix-helix protein, CopG family [Verrucomicrobiales bacterium]|nr:ribbon-helix-helix protein, CopG family [Verrucomicrobiales bacterium]
MQKIQILFPDPQMDALRKLAKIEDRPVSEIVRRAVDRDLAQRSGMLQRGSSPPPAFPTFDAGRVFVSAAKMKSVLYDDEIR